MDILNLLSCFEPRKPDNVYDADLQKQAFTGLGNAQVPKDFFSELLNNVQELGENAERGMKELGENLGSIFGLQEKREVPETTDPPNTAPPKNTQKPPSPPPNYRTVTFSDGLHTTKVSSYNLEKLKEALQKNVARTGSLLEIRVNQQFENFNLIKKLQEDYLEKRELMKSQENTPQASKTNIELGEINTKIEFLALGGDPSQIGSQKSSSSIKLNPEQIGNLLNKVYTFRKRFYYNEGKVGIIMHFLNKWKGYVSALEEKKDDIVFKHITVPKKTELTLLQQINQTKIELGRNVHNRDPKTSPAKDLLEILFKFIALGGKDTVNVSKILVYIQTAFGLNLQGINEQAKSIKSEIINNKVSSLQQQVLSSRSTHARHSGG